jgi:ankyrin repeat protein
LKKIKTYKQFLNEEFKHLRGPNDKEIEIAYSNMTPDEAVVRSIAIEDIDGFKKALNRVEDINTKNDYSWTFLFTAVQRGNLEIVKILVENGANVNITDYNRNTPAILAAKYGFLDILKYLVEKGADINMMDYDGITPLKAAEKYGRSEVVEYLYNL